MQWRVRRASEADAAALSLVAGATFLETFAGVLAGIDIISHVAANSSAAKFAAWATDPTSVVVLAEAIEGAAPLAYSLLTTPDLPIEPMAGDIELKRIYTLAPLHGSGLGAAMMRRALDDAQVLSGKRLVLGVYGGNLRAQRFYDKQGFDVIGTRRFLVGATGHDDLIFGRSI